MSIIKSLLAVEVYELTGMELGKIRNQYKGDRYFNDKLPEYCLHENGTIRRTEDYLQWVETGSEKFLLLNINTADQLLDHEISAVGLDEFFDNIDIRPFLTDFTKYTADQLFRNCTHAEYLIVNLLYTRQDDYYGGGYEVELDVSIEGRLEL